MDCRTWYQYLHIVALIVSIAFQDVSSSKRSNRRLVSIVSHQRQRLSSSSLQSTPPGAGDATVYEARSKLLERALQDLRIRYNELAAENAGLRESSSRNSSYKESSTIEAEAALKATQVNLEATQVRLAAQEDLWREAKEKIIRLLNEASRLRLVNTDLSNSLAESQDKTEELKVTMAALTAEKVSAEGEVAWLKNQLREREQELLESNRQQQQVASTSLTVATEQVEGLLQQAVSIATSAVEQRKSAMDSFIVSDIKEQRRLLEKQGEILESLVAQLSPSISRQLPASGASGDRSEDFRSRLSRKWSSSSDEPEDNRMEFDYNFDDREVDEYLESDWRGRGSKRVELRRKSGRLLRGIGEFAGVCAKSAVDILGFWVGLGYDDVDEENDEDGDGRGSKKKKWSPAAVISPQGLPDVGGRSYPVAENAEEGTVSTEKWGATEGYNRLFDSIDRRANVIE